MKIIIIKATHKNMKKFFLKTLNIISKTNKNILVPNMDKPKLLIVS